jgi:hydrogenase maturation protease
MAGDQSAGTMVVALGNSLMGDDGLGLAALTSLSEGWTFEPPIAFVDGGTSGLNLLTTLGRDTHVLFIDAIDVGAPPGTVVALNRGDLARRARAVRSAHQISLVDVLQLLELRDGARACIAAVGLQPESVALRPALSPTVAAGIPHLVKAIIAKLRDWGHTARPVGAALEAQCTS